jgi:predicted lipoprotein
VLAATVREVVSPVIAAAEIESRSLATLVGRLGTSPASSDLERVRSAWKRTANAWKAASVFRDGPLAASGALSRAASWPTRRDAVDDLLGSSHPIDSKAVEGLAIDAKGLYAMEYLLFDAETHELAVTGLAGARGDRARVLAAGYSDDVALAARSAADVVNAPESEFATSYAAGGATNLAHLVGQMVESPFAGWDSCSGSTR